MRLGIVMLLQCIKKQFPVQRKKQTACLSQKHEHFSDHMHHNHIIKIPGS
ncbi:hypothetical protein A311_03870 [Escherichia coli KTE146]|nr:hypothetical protein A311_03870 [Escherichia coli KTE146]